MWTVSVQGVVLCRLVLVRFDRWVVRNSHRVDRTALIPFCETNFGYMAAAEQGNHTDDIVLERESATPPISLEDELRRLRR